MARKKAWTEREKTRAWNEYEALQNKADAAYEKASSMGATYKEYSSKRGSHADT